MSARTFGATPALFTNRSSRPNFSRVKEISFARSSPLLISAWQISARIALPAVLATAMQSTVVFCAASRLPPLVDDEV